MGEGVERVLFVHAHPDDETITTGATIATLVEGGAEVAVLTCTRGERGEVIPADLQHLAGAALGVHRESELAAALDALGVTEHYLLGQPRARWAGRLPRRYLDSGMLAGARGKPVPLDTGDDSLTAADPGEVAADIAAVIIAFQPHVVVSYAAERTAHPDHVRTHDATRTAAEVLGVPFYVIDGATSKPGPVSVDPAPVADRKRAALLAHRSQVIVEGDSFSLAAGPVQPIAARESFTRLRPLGSDFADHGLPSRIAALLLAVILGAFAGMTLTVAHQASVTLGPFTVPWGIIAGLAITAALIAGLRLVFHTRLVALCAAVALLLVSGLLATQSLGGSVLVPANPAGYAWTFGPVLIVLVTLGWPRLVRQGQPRASGNIGTPAVKGPDLP